MTNNIPTASFQHIFSPKNTKVNKALKTEVEIANVAMTPWLTPADNAASKEMIPRYAPTVLAKEFPNKPIILPHLTVTPPY
jgi:hypothetical protein